jgi:hypothetical protein
MFHVVRETGFRTKCAIAILTWKAIPRFLEKTEKAKNKHWSEYSANILTRDHMHTKDKF